MWQYNDTLCHYGILGMRWGVRRYQNKDGTLTAAGKKRAAKLESKLNKLNGNQNGTETVTKSSKKRGIKDLSDEELKTMTTRLRAEKDYMDLERQVANLNPKQVSKGKAFVDHVGKNVVKPALTDSAKGLLKSWVDKKGKEILGLDVKDAKQELADEVKSLNLKKQKMTLDDWFNEREKADTEKRVEADIEERIRKMDEKNKRRCR